MERYITIVKNVHGSYGTSHEYRSEYWSIYDTQTFNEDALGGEIRYRHVMECRDAASAIATRVLLNEEWQRWQEEKTK